MGTKVCILGRTYGGVKHSHYLIADNMGIRDYYKEKYGKEKQVFWHTGLTFMRITMWTY